MNEPMVTYLGNVATEVRHVVSDRQVHLSSFRLACTPRRFDRAQQRWVDADTIWLTVTCWRQLAANVASSVSRGDPVVVSGRLRVRNYERKDGNGRGQALELEASCVGHDLARGTAAFKRSARIEEAAPAREQELLEEMATGLAEESYDGDDGVALRERAGGAEADAA